ncbi:deoxyribonuclease NucA/NucB-domain-containing protein [Desarmillaria tabescens]|uniref:Deoxyribonuclease NucA/NucB-domain-containing protein n=1 Tax=Armillaria tabescens TaxID=1929756 RepID=A0AA39J5T2_ARMTA|nr:deoxyribonuclease NucA/NucB-domain-containing protein [Desarmillaria tabescens]KAK0436656.1 deoxyribonuclease NucA/NucB-domain-containing protein [Desarmillaria tabescens]
MYCQGKFNSSSTNDLRGAHHSHGYQCDEWPWVNSNAGGANVVMRCIPGSDNGGSGAQWGNFINNKGPQAVGYALKDNIDFAKIEISHVPVTAKFCLGVLGTTIKATTCNQLDRGQPFLQRIG